MCKMVILSVLSLLFSVAARVNLRWLDFFFLDPTNALGVHCGWKQHYRKPASLCQGWYIVYSEGRLYWYLTVVWWLHETNSWVRFSLLKAKKPSSTIAPLLTAWLYMSRADWIWFLKWCLNIVLVYPLWVQVTGQCSLPGTGRQKLLILLAKQAFFEVPCVLQNERWGSWSWFTERMNNV